MHGPRPRPRTGFQDGVEVLASRGWTRPWRGAVSRGGVNCRVDEVSGGDPQLRAPRVRRHPLSVGRRRRAEDAEVSLGAVRGGRPRDAGEHGDSWRSADSTPTLLVLGTLHGVRGAEIYACARPSMVAGRRPSRRRAGALVCHRTRAASAPRSPHRRFQACGTTGSATMIAWALPELVRERREWSSGSTYHIPCSSSTRARWHVRGTIRRAWEMPARPRFGAHQSVAYDL